MEATRGLRAYARIALAAGLVASGCSAEVTIADDDGGRGDLSSGASGDAGEGGSGGAGGSSSSSSTSPSTGSSTSEGAVEAARTACFDYYYSCNHLVSSPLDVDYASCAELQTRPECAPLLQALFECATQPDGNEHMSCDYELEDRCDREIGLDYDQCMNPRGCGGSDECETWNPDTGCSCNVPCRDGHTATVTCRPNPGPGGNICDCSFDGASVGQCENPKSGYDTCYFDLSCCQLLLD